MGLEKITFWMAAFIKDDKIPKRLNPKTGKEFKRGDFDPKTKNSGVDQLNFRVNH